MRAAALRLPPLIPSLRKNSRAAFDSLFIQTNLNGVEHLCQYHIDIGVDWLHSLREVSGNAIRLQLITPLCRARRRSRLSSGTGSVFRHEPSRFSMRSAMSMWFIRLQISESSSRALFR